jgi:hypothetical protein
MMFKPQSPPRPALLRVQSAAAKDEGCFAYQGQRGDFVSRVATRFGLTIQEFLQFNVGRIPAMDASLVGKSLLVCQIRPSSAWTVQDANGVTVNTRTPTATARTSTPIVQGA